ncbi:MAG: ATP-binding cassette domain-containing protein [Lachnospiraceae bacterium]
MIRLEHLTVAAKDKILLHDVSLEIRKSEAIGLTGQSGSGKSTILKSIMGILSGGCKIRQGSIWLGDQAIDKLSGGKRRQLAGTTIGFIPQNPMTAFDNRIKIGRQLEETLCLRLGLSKQEADRLADEMMLSLNLEDTERIKHCFPSELSGGMLQRIAVSILLALKPEYILADEPTSALDEENTGILLRELKKQKRNTGILLVSHDMEALRQLCSYLYVIEGGRIVEQDATDKVLGSPEQTWTKMFVSAYQKPDDGGWLWKEL